MKLSILPLTALLAGLAPALLQAQTESAVQSAARPFNLDIASPVYLAGSDAKSADFQSNSLPGLMNLVNENLREYQAVSDVGTKALDPTKLTLNTAAQVRVYFLGEGAGFWNTLGVNLNGTGPVSGDPLLIFPNASSHDSWYNYNSSPDAARSTSAPLRAGDFVDMGTVAGGTTLDFFLLADGARSPSLSRTWTADTTLNSDGLQHVVSFAVQDSPYLLIGFEDLAGGGDRDYNDVVFAVEIGAANVTALANPEPHTVLSLLLLAGAVLYFRGHLARRTEEAAPAR